MIKKCIKCEFEGEINFFRKHANVCSKCHSKYTIEWIKNNPEKVLATKKIYRKNNKEKISSYDREYRKNNIDNISDEYVKGLLTKGTNLKAKDIPDELSNTYRELIKLKREIKGKL